MGISLEEVHHVARLARLDLDEAELMAFQGELNALLGHFQDLSEVDVTGKAAKPHAVTLLNVMAHDMPVSGLTREQALSNAPSSRAGLFLVPTVIED